MQRQRIAAIDTYWNFAGLSSMGTRVRSYRLTYEPLVNGSNQSLRATNVSRLQKITEFTGDLSDSMPPLEFAYAEDKVFDRAVAQSYGGSIEAPTPVKCGGPTHGRAALLCP